MISIFQNRSNTTVERDRCKLRLQFPPLRFGGPHFHYKGFPKFSKCFYVFQFIAAS